MMETDVFEAKLKSIIQYGLKIKNEDNLHFFLQSTCISRAMQNTHSLCFESLTK